MIEFAVKVLQLAHSCIATSASKLASILLDAVPHHTIPVWWICLNTKIFFKLFYNLFYSIRDSNEVKYNVGQA